MRTVPPVASASRVSATARRPTAGTSRWTLAVIVALGGFTSLLSSTAVNVAVPDLQQVFHASLTEVQWVLTGYLLGLATTIPLTGWATERFGTKRVYLVTLGTFTVTSVLCGLAWSIQSEITFRVIQGLAGGMIMPCGMAILLRMAPPHERGRMMSFIGVPMMLAPALGPTLGGVIIQIFDWRAIFWVNLPTGLLALFLAWRKMEESRHQSPGRFDWLGALTASPGVALLLYGMTQATRHGWGSLSAALPLAGGLILLAGFVLWELRSERPLLDLRIFGNGTYRAAMTVTAVVAMSLFGPTFLVPLFLEQVQHRSVLNAGLILGAQGLGAALVMPISGWLTDRYGGRPVVSSGVATLAMATVFMTQLGPSTSTLHWVVVLALRGMGIGFSMMPAVSAAYTGLAPEQIGRATALTNTLQRTFSSFGIAILATVVSSRLAADLSSLGRPSPAFVTQAYDQAFWVAGALALLALPVALLIRRPFVPGGRQDRIPYRLASVVAVLATAASLYSLSVAFNLVAAPAGWHAW